MSALGGRLRLVGADALTDAQRELFERLSATAVPWARGNGFAATTTGNRLIGPFNPSLLSPEIATAFLELQASEEQHTSLDERVRQVVILTVGAVWQAPYELYAHSAVARQAGLSAAAVTGLIGGDPLDALTDAERTAHRVARALSTSHRLDDELYRKAEETFGAAGVFEIAVLTGIYHTVCSILNTFEIPAP